MEAARHLLQAGDAPEPLITAVDLRLATGHGIVFEHLTVQIPRGALVAVTGRAGAGKSALLLALTGRMRGVTGTLTVDGHDAARHPRRVRRETSVARIDDLIVAEPSLSLNDCITERTLADAAPARSRMANYLHTAHLLGLTSPLGTLYGDLPPADQVRASVALATIRPAPLVVLDDIDRETTALEQEDLWAGLARLAAEGVTVIATTSELTTLPQGILTIEMEPTHAR